VVPGGLCPGHGLRGVRALLVQLGLGYDALEYLVIGRGLAEGGAIDDFIPSKGWALYALLGGVFKMHPARIAGRSRP